MLFKTRFLVYLFLTRAAATYNTTLIACRALSSTLPGTVFFPDSSTYNASILSYPFPQLRLHPNCIIRPRSAQDVSSAIKILRNGHTKFALRGGGHNANVGYNNIDDGVTIDMRSLSSVSVVANTAQVGAGAIWQEVYDTLEPHKLTVLGGRIGVVGVAGFLTGGGISFWSPERGWACDYVSNFEIVLANADIVNANATSRPDLFAALKGGQSNFGIVTRFDLQTIPDHPMWGGRIAFSPLAETELLNAFTDFKDPANFDPYAAGWVTFRYNGTTKGVTPTSILWYTRPEIKPGGLRNITGITAQNTNGMTTAYAGEFARNASMVVKTSSFRTIWATTTFRISPVIVGRIHSAWRELIPEICDTFSYANVASELTFQALMPPPRNGTSPNSLGFAPDATPEKDLVFLQIIFYFSDERATQGLNKALRRFIQQFDSITEDEGVGSRYRYLNFAAWFQDPLAGYGEEQLQQLKIVAKKYDPTGIFQRKLSGGFKLS